MVQTMTVLLSAASSLFFTVALVEAAARGSNARKYDDSSYLHGLECSVLADGTTQCYHDGIARGRSSSKPLSTPSRGGKVAACADKSPDCAQRAEDHGCIEDFESMREDCRETCVLCNNLIDSHFHALYNEEAQHVPVLHEEQKGTLDVIAETEKYMHEMIYLSEEYSVESVIACQNRHRSCSFWSSIGECENNQEFMLANCGPACQNCGKVIFEERCPAVDEELLATSVWSAGDLNKMFERIVSDEEWNAYNLQILSQPEPKMDGVQEGPWVITLDDFLSADECETYIALGAKSGYERSTDVSDEMNPDGTFDGVVSEDRTSTNAWCDDECADHEVNKAVHDRMEKLLGIPEPNYEHLQLLRYEVGQKYGVHHDYIDTQAERAPGPRILTVFLYLNDVEAGGGTNFPELNLTVQPKRGRALLWPSVLDEDPDEIDDRTDHQALPVEKGIKFGANAWVHLRDFKGPHEDDCH